MNKYYFGPRKDDMMRNHRESLSLGMIGLLEEYSTRMAESMLQYPWITLHELMAFCKDDESSIQYYIQEGLDTGCLMQLSEDQALRLEKDPFHNCWIYE